MVKNGFCGNVYLRMYIIGDIRISSDVKDPSSNFIAPTIYPEML